MSDTTETANAPSIHGHDIIHLLHDAATPFTRQALAALVAQRFGTDARFHTCSAGGMTLDQLLHFLIIRGKVVEAEGKLYTDMSKVCGHGEHDHDHGH